MCDKTSTQTGVTIRSSVTLARTRWGKIECVFSFIFLIGMILLKRYKPKPKLSSYEFITALQTSFAWHSASTIAFHSRMGASTRGIALGSPHNSVRLHTSVWEKSPPLRRGSADSSKQCLQGFCSTTRTFLPSTEGAIEEIPQSDIERGFFSRYFLVPKRDGGLRPILDLRRLNFSLYKGKFKMLTMKTIMSQIQGGDWFVTIDLKDAYFHIQVIQRHRKFLRFAFGGKAYQYKVLPFGLALAPRTFTKCMDAALARAPGLG